MCSCVHEFVYVLCIHGLRVHPYFMCVSMICVCTHGLRVCIDDLCIHDCVCVCLIWLRVQSLCLFSLSTNVRPCVHDLCVLPLFMIVSVYP